MAYKDILAKAIKDKGLSLRELANKCKDLGVNITPSYISQIQTGKLPPPSDEVSKAISNICGVDENVLILEAYFDKAPSCLIFALEFLKMDDDSNRLNISNFLERNGYIEFAEQGREYINHRTLAEFIADVYSDMQNGSTTISRNSGDNTEGIEQETTEENSILPFMKTEMKDNAMYPLIPINSTVFFESNNSYNNGEIICFSINNEKDNFMIRKYFIKDKLIILTPLNSEFEPIVCNLSDIKIFGKVNKIITNI